MAFAQAWDRWFIEHPRSEVPPALVVLTGVEGPEFGNGWQPPYDWSAGHGAREKAVRARIDALRAALPPSFSDFVAVGLSDQTPYGIVEHLLPALAMHLNGRADRPAPPAPRDGRPIQGRPSRPQLGDQGRSLWGNLRSRKKARSETS